MIREYNIPALSVGSGVRYCRQYCKRDAHHVHSIAGALACDVVEKGLDYDLYHFVLRIHYRIGEYCNSQPALSVVRMAIR